MIKPVNTKHTLKQTIKAKDKINQYKNVVDVMKGQKQLLKMPNSQKELQIMIKNFRTQRLQAMAKV
jgi:hypothetical protein